jgi:hypothetical protein
VHDLVLVPSYFRPEYLYLTLEFLGKAEGGADKHVWVSQDAHFHDYTERGAMFPQIETVCRNAGQYFQKLRYIQRQPHAYVGNPSNFLELYKEAHEQRDVRYVYLVEDDVLVAPDFFRWHEAVHERSDYFCSVGWHCTRNKSVLPTKNPNTLIESARDFTSIGVCWKREKLHRVAGHARRDYYSNLKGYMQAAFPHSPMPSHKWNEQAGLIMRILLNLRGSESVCWPGLRRCSHIGMSGYHRRNGYQFAGPLDQRIANLRSVISSTKAMRALSVEKYDDIDELPDIDEWDKKDLQVVQKIPYDGSYE